MGFHELQSRLAMLNREQLNHQIPLQCLKVSVKSILKQLKQSVFPQPRQTTYLIAECQSRRIASSNSAASRSIEVPVSHLPRDSSTRSASQAAGQATWPSSSGPPISQGDEATLRQRQTFYGEDHIDRLSVGTQIPCELRGADCP